MPVQLPRRDVVATLEGVCSRIGYPKTIRVDQGSEFISRDMDLWAYRYGVTLDFSRPGKPTDNAFAEAFNARLRAECLNAHWFLTLADATEKLEAWRRDLYEFVSVKPLSSPQVGSQPSASCSAFSTSTCIRSGDETPNHDPDSWKPNARRCDGTKLQLGEVSPSLRPVNVTPFSCPSAADPLSLPSCRLEFGTVGHKSLLQEPPQRDSKLPGKSDDTDLAGLPRLLGEAAAIPPRELALWLVA